mmetsp:Transcript_11018/g.28648  ORF Transcript_11018/g.28648 Transcript_11018/m.28648 type:complete len:221 (-) Transcript_11018:128-790(-)
MYTLYVRYTPATKKLSLDHHAATMTDGGPSRDDGSRASLKMPSEPETRPIAAWKQRPVTRHCSQSSGMRFCRANAAHASRTSSCATVVCERTVYRKQRWADVYRAVHMYDRSTSSAWPLPASTLHTRVTRCERGLADGATGIGSSGTSTTSATPLYSACASYEPKKSCTLSSPSARPLAICCVASMSRSTAIITHTHQSGAAERTSTRLTHAGASELTRV